MSVNDPKYAPTVNTLQPIKVSVSTSASARAAGVGPFRGLFCIASTSYTMVGIKDVSVAIDSQPKNTVLWIQGSYVTVLNASAATATAVDTAAVLFGVI